MSVYSKKYLATLRMLIGSMLAGIVSGILAMKGKGEIAVLLMLAGAVVPAIWAPFTFLLVIGGVVCFFGSLGDRMQTDKRRHPDGWEGRS